MALPEDHPLMRYDYTRNRITPTEELPENQFQSLLDPSYEVDVPDYDEDEMERLEQIWDDIETSIDLNFLSYGNF